MACDCIGAVKKAAAAGLPASRHIRAAHAHGHSFDDINAALHSGMSTRSPSLVRKSTMTSAFGVTLYDDDISKAFTEKGKKRQERRRQTAAHDRELRSNLSRGERVGAELGGVLASAKDAPRGKKRAAAKTHASYMTNSGNPYIGTHKRGTTHSGARAHTRQTIGKSAFGVELISKDAPNAAPSAGRRTAGAVLGPYHAAVAGKKGKKLAATGSSIGHVAVGNTAGAIAGAKLGRALGAKGEIAGSAVGGLAGSLAGGDRAVTTNSRKGRYKPESR